MSLRPHAIIGFGKTAQSAVRFLLARFQGIRIRVSDTRVESSFPESLILEFREAGVEFSFGEQSLEFLDFAEDVFFLISPGVPPTSSLIQSIVKLCKKKPQKNYGTDFDLFTKYLDDSQEYLAVTGTNGKTTTTSLLAHALGTPALGNIGKPFLDFYELDAKVFPVELSSAQLYYSTEFHQHKLPLVAVFLNFVSDHLDWHRDLAEYFEAKLKLFQHSSRENFWLVNYDDEKLRKFFLQKIQEQESNTKLLFFSTRLCLTELTDKQVMNAYLKDAGLYINCSKHGERLVIKTDELQILGDHNYSNALAAILALKLAGMDLLEIATKFASFKAVKHRLEYVGTVNNNKFYNDSKATNPDSATKALNAFDKSIAIIGGKNKNLDLEDFAKVLSQKCHAVVLIGELKEAIAVMLDKLGFENYTIASSFEEAVNLCIEYGRANDLPVLLSPASSSFDMFKNYEQRGDEFARLVRMSLV